MCVFYIICALIVVFANISSIGAVFTSIFKGAFTGQAAIGGFAGAAVSATIRNGLARGVFSNDAGLGASATMQSQAESIDHPAQQGMWAVMETFIDTIVICTLTGLLILFSGSWTAGGDGSTFSAAALGSVLGVVGQYALEIPTDLSAYHVSRDDIDFLTDSAFEVKRLLDQNPKPMTKADIRKIYETLFPA